MKKRLVAVVVTLIIVLSSVVPVFAGPGTGGVPPILLPPAAPAGTSAPICIVVNR